MKNPIPACLSLSLVLMVAAPPRTALAQEAPAQTARVIIGVSPFLDKAVKDDVYRRIVGYVLEDAPLNSAVSIYDAHHLLSVCRMEVPNVRAFKSGKTRANQFKEPIAKLRDFLAATHERPSDSGKFNWDSAVRFPQFMDFVADNLAAPGSALVVVLGSPLYLDPKEPGFSMVDGLFPSDAHLNASRDRSVFGLKTRVGALNGFVVHYGYFGDPWVSEAHQDKVNRFWTLYLKGQGAGLATFCGDLATVFSAVRNSSDTPARDPRYAVDPAQTKVEMLRVSRDVRVADWITRELPATGRPAPPVRMVGTMKIGIRWKGNIDLDLYARPSARGETLFFEHARSPEGYYYKDHRSSPDREYEFIEFETPVDLREVEATINFFAGTAPGGPAGEVRVEFDGKIFSGRFSLAASHGNEGREGIGQGEFWTRIDIPELLGVREGRRQAALPR